MNEVINQTESLAAQLKALQETVARQQAEMTRLKDQMQMGLPAQTLRFAPQGEAEESRPATSSRRKLLRRAALGAAAGVTALSAATVLTGPQSAQAATASFTDGVLGDAVVKGTNLADTDLSSGVTGQASGTTALVKGVLGVSKIVSTE